MAVETNDAEAAYGIGAPDLGAAPPQLAYALDNPGAPGTIYVSADPADNKLTLTMSATSAATFSPGTLVPPADAMGGTGSLLYLNLTPLGLTAAEFNALKLVADGWNSALYSGTSGQYVAFTPTATVPLQPVPAKIAFALDGFTLAQQPGASASLEVLAYRVTGISSGNFPVSGSIGVVFALPDHNTGDLTTAMQVGFTPSQVVTSLPQYPTVANQLMLTMTQQPNAPTINAGANTLFTLNFAYSTDPNGFGALLTIDEGKAIQVSAAQGTTGWTITPNLNADPPYWTLTPPANQPIFTPGLGSTLAFDITNVVTIFQPGPTVALIGYSNVTGYKNGSFAVMLVKQPHVLISSFSATPTQAVLGSDGKASVTLNWSTTYATQLTLDVGGHNVDVTGRTSYTATGLQDTTDFQLVATGNSPGGGDNRAFSQTITVPVLPAINSMTLAPTGSDPHSLTLAWNVTTNAETVLVDTGGGGFPYPPVHQLPLTITAPSLCTLSAKAGLAGPSTTATAMWPPNWKTVTPVTGPQATTSFLLGAQFTNNPPGAMIGVTVNQPAPLPPLVQPPQPFSVVNLMVGFQIASWPPGAQGTLTVIWYQPNLTPLPANAQSNVVIAITS